jgi:Pectate lyase superfamily protein
MSIIETIRTALYGMPPSQAYQPSKEGVIDAFDQLVQSVTVLSGGIVGSTATIRATKALLDAVSAAADTLGLVYGDPVSANNGIYHRTGGVWVFTGLLGIGMEGPGPTNETITASTATSVGAATSATTSANIALAASLTAPNVYATTAAGLAAVGEGQTFWSNQSGSPVLYRDVAGVAVALDMLGNVRNFASTSALAAYPFSHPKTATVGSAIYTTSAVSEAANPLAIQSTSSPGSWYIPQQDTSIQVADGTTLRTYLGKGKDNSPINVMDYGAIGNGIANDTTAILAACAAANTAGGRRVYAPHGNYLFDGDAFGGDGVIIEGDGRNSTIFVSRLDSPTNGRLFNMAGNGGGLRNVGFKANVAQTGGSYVHLGGIENTIENFSMQGDFNGIRMRGSVCAIRNGRMSLAATGATRILCEGGDNSQSISGVLMGAEASPNTALAGIRVRNSSALTINNVSAIQQGSGLLIDPSSGTTDTGSNGSVFSLKVSDCFFDNNTYNLKVSPSSTGGVYRSNFINTWFGSGQTNNIYMAGSIIKGLHFIGCDNVLALSSGINTGSGIEDIVFLGGRWSGNLYGGYFNQAFPGLAIVGVAMGISGGFSDNTNQDVVLLDAAFTDFNIKDNTWRGAGSKILNNAAYSAGQIRNNIGLKTEASGQGNIAVGQTVATITHGLNFTPTAQDITFGFASSPTASGVSSLYITAIGATTFQIVSNAVVATTACTVVWKASIT